MDLRRAPGDDDRAQGEELLPGADLPDALRGRGASRSKAGSNGRAWSRGRALAEGRPRGVCLRRGRDRGAGDPAASSAREAARLPEGLGLAPPKTEVRHEGPLEQRLGDQFGWEELVADVARIYRSLPAEERAKTGIFASNYGEAGALHLFGPAYGLPWRHLRPPEPLLLGPAEAGARDPDLAPVGRRGVEDHCRSVEKAGEHFHPWGMAEENRAIYLCRGLKHTIAEYWTPDFKHWN